MSELITDAGTLRRVERSMREQGGVLGDTPEEQYVKRAAVATPMTAQPIITLGLSKGWRFCSRDDGQVDLWAPISPSGKATTYTFKNVALWRAIKIRGISLT